MGKSRSPKKSLKGTRVGETPPHPIALVVMTWITCRRWHYPAFQDPAHFRADWLLASVFFARMR
jgi:hypothetical protein